MDTPLRNFTTICLLALCLLPPALTGAEKGVVAWSAFFSGPSGASTADGVASDSSNNVIVTGGYAKQCVTIKYSSSGVPLWTNYWADTTNTAYGFCAATDTGGNAIVTGKVLTGTGNSCQNDYMTIKYSGDGVPLWTNRFHGSSGSSLPCSNVSRLAVDSNNNVVVVGATSLSQNLFSVLTIKYSPEGVPLWTNAYSGPWSLWTQENDLAVDENNNVSVVSGAGAYATIKYSSAGVPLWTNIYSDNSPNAARIATDRGGNVIVTGTANSGYATVKYSSDGVALWTNCYTRYATGSHASCVAIDANANVFVTGYFDSRGFATIKYSSDGVPLWTNLCAGPYGFASSWTEMAVDSSGNAIVMSMNVWYNATATVKYSSAGAPLWTNVTGYTAHDFKLDSNGNALLTGWNSSNPSSFWTVKYFCMPSPVLTGHPLADGTLQLRVDGVASPATLVISASTELTNWLPIFTNTTATNVIFHTDTDATNYNGRFYRAFQHP
jgi:hypothetical protein